MSDKLNEKFEELVTEAGIIVEAGDPMPTVTAAVIPGGQGSAPGQVKDAQTRGGAQDPQPTVTPQAVAPYKQTSGTDLGGPRPDGNDEGEDNPGAKAAAPVSQVTGDAQQRPNGSGKDEPSGSTPKFGSEIAYGTSEGPDVSYPIKPSYEELDLSGDVAALTEGEDLSEDFKEKAKTILEAAVKSKLAEEAAKLEEKFEASVNEKVEEIKSALAEEVSGTVNYAITTWVESNQVAIDRGIRNEITEDFIAGLKNLFTEHYISIPDEKVDVVEGLAEDLRKMEERLDEQVKANVELNNRLNESSRDIILSQISEGLADTQKEKLASLAEGVTFESVEKFTEAVKTLRESYFPQAAAIAEATDETPVESEENSPAMAAYLQAISRWK